MRKMVSCAAVVLASGCDLRPADTAAPEEDESGVSEASIETRPPAGPVGPDDFGGITCPYIGTRPRIVRLSEVMPGPCDDQIELQKILFEIGPYGKLVVDKVCTLDAGIRLPNPFVLAGVGEGGGGTLSFSHDGIGISVCQEAPRSYVTIEDLEIFGPMVPGRANEVKHSIGIALANLNIVQLNRVRVSSFFVGVKGSSTFSVDIDGSNISMSGQDNIVIGYNSNGWRIRDGLSSQAGRHAINVLGPGDATPIIDVDGHGNDAVTSNDLLVDGVRMECNGHAAVRTAAYATRIINNRFEGNGADAGLAFRPAVQVTSNANGTRLLTNLFTGTQVDCLLDQGVDSQRAFNIPAAASCAPGPALGRRICVNANGP